MGGDYSMRKNRISIRTELLLAYCILALLPMLLITFYTYFSTRDILTRQMKEQLTQKLEQNVRTINEKTQKLYSVSNTLYTDDVLYNYVTADYRERGFEDLYYYVRNLFSRIRILYPEITQLSIYSTNDTLPQDLMYFYYLTEEELEAWRGYAGEKGSAFQAVKLEEGKLSFIRSMNLYERGKLELFLRMDIASSALEDILQYTDGSVGSLEDAYGNILRPFTASSEPQEERDWLSISMETEHCGTLTNSVNISALQREAEYSASRVFMVFLIASVVAVTAIYLFSSYFRYSVKRVIEGAREIGSGNLTFRINARKPDELGEVAEEINQLGEKLNTLIEDSYKKEIDRKESELNLLQEQINPHFLYNALSSISSLARKSRDTDTCNAILSLAEFYRISLNKGKKILKVREEIKLLNSYLAVQKLRFGDIIKVEYDLQEDLLDQEMIKLVLQPIVENAIHHGRYNDQEEFHIRIQLFSCQDRMIFTISDDGMGIAADKLMLLQSSMEKSQNGMGLRNVNSRIKLQYGTQYGVSLESQPYLGTIIRVELPVGSCNEETSEGL